MKPLSKPLAQRRAAPDEHPAKDVQPDRAVGSFPADQTPNVTAGLKWAPEMCPKA